MSKNIINNVLKNMFETKSSKKDIYSFKHLFSDKQSNNGINKKMKERINKLPISYAPWTVGQKGEFYHFDSGNTNKNPTNISDTEKTPKNTIYNIIKQHPHLMSEIENFDKEKKGEVLFVQKIMLPQKESGVMIRKEDDDTGDTAMVSLTQSWNEPKQRKFYTGSTVFHEIKHSLSPEMSEADVNKYGNIRASVSTKFGGIPIDLPREKKLEIIEEKKTEGVKSLFRDEQSPNKKYSGSALNWMHYVKAGFKPVAMYQLDLYTPEEKERIIQYAKNQGLNIKMDRDTGFDGKQYDALIVYKGDLLKNKTFKQFVKEKGGYGKAFGYPHKADIGWYNFLKSHSDNPIGKQTRDKLVKQGILQDDYDLLEFVPLNMSKDEIIQEINKRKQALQNVKFDSESKNDIFRRGKMRKWYEEHGAKVHESVWDGIDDVDRLALGLSQKWIIDVDIMRELLSISANYNPRNDKEATYYVEKIILPMYLKGEIKVIPPIDTDDEEEVEKLRKKLKEDRKSKEYKVEEDSLERSVRVNRGYTKIIDINARKLAKKYEKDQGEKLAWNQERLESARKREIVNSYPQVYVTGSGKLDINDGRHRLAVAAEREETVPIAVKPGIMYFDVESENNSEKINVCEHCRKKTKILYVIYDNITGKKKICKECYTGNKQMRDVGKKSVYMLR